MFGPAFKMTTYDDHCIMWRVSGQAVDRRSQILLMTSQINERDHFARVVADLLRRLAVGIVDGPAFRIETQNFVTY